MWLEKPARLVIDVFASSGDRNAIRATAQDSTDADEKEEKAPVKAAEAPKPADPKTAAAATAPAAAAANTMVAVSATPAGQARSIFATPATAPKEKKKSRRQRLMEQAMATPSGPSADSPSDFSSFHRNTDYLCFPANTQVGLSVFFSPKNKRMPASEEVRMDIQNTHNRTLSPSAIVCYPASAQVEASISYREDRPFNVSAPEKK